MPFLEAGGCFKLSEYECVMIEDHLDCCLLGPMCTCLSHLTLVHAVNPCFITLTDSSRIVIDSFQSHLEVCI